jgi:prepilin-type processing-associated H-X9-DG protein
VWADSTVAATSSSRDGNTTTGHDWDILRWTYMESRPRQDRPGHNCPECFGSPHSAAANYVFCDGAVHSITYSVDTEMLRRAGHRNDGLPLEFEGF